MIVRGPFSCSGYECVIALLVVVVAVVAVVVSACVVLTPLSLSNL